MSSCVLRSAIRYYDTSALLPLYLPEAASEAAQVALERDFGQLVTSVISLVELRSGLARYQREGFLSRDQAGVVFHRAERDLAQTPRRLELTPDVLQEALRLLGSHTHQPMRTLDVLHIATCLRYDTSGFVTNDRHQAKLAANIGLEVTWLGGDLEEPA